MVNRIIRAIIPESLKESAMQAWVEDGSPKATEWPDSITWYEDTKSDHFKSLQDLFTEHKVPFDCLYVSEGEEPKWFCYRPGTPSGCFTHGISETPDPDCKPLPEC